MKFHIDFAQIVTATGCVLLMRGKIKPTPKAIGALILLSMCEARVEWEQ